MCVVYYKYNITLYSLIIRKNGGFITFFFLDGGGLVTCVYIIIML